MLALPARHFEAERNGVVWLRGGSSMSSQASPSSAPSAASAAEPAGPPLITRIGSALLKPFVTLLADIGGTARLLYDTVFWFIRPPYRISLFLEAMEFVGVQSLFIVGLTGLFIGMVFGIQLVDGFR